MPAASSAPVATPVANVGIPDQFQAADFMWTVHNVTAQNLFQPPAAATTAAEATKDAAPPAEQQQTIKLMGQDVRVPRRKHLRNRGKIRFLEPCNMTAEQKSLFEELRMFYDQQDDKVLKMVFRYGEELQSTALRVINCAVTSYASHCCVKYRVHQDGTVTDLTDGSRMNAAFDPASCRVIDLVSEYEFQLKRWNKKLFDPCRRHERICWPMRDGSRWVTTLGQLNFFRWAVRIGLLRWCDQNHSKLMQFLNGEVHRDHPSSVSRKRKRSVGRTRPRTSRRRKKKNEPTKNGCVLRMNPPACFQPPPLTNKIPG